ncbi:HdeD family acid-resistance protein [Pseudonocardia sp.]|uniref:HdeD family acid-resistance protein n=1 Tax=Pseudonocardia sp. TaxID=60912 RepID=UPI003D14DCDD
MTEQAGSAAPTSAATPASGGRDVADTMASVGGSKWWWVAYGVLTVIAGILAVFWPAVTAVVLAVVFGIQLFILGIFRIVAAFAVPDTSTSTKIIGVLIGILAIIAGVICLRSPVGTAVILAIVVGAFWLVTGVMELIAGIAGRGERSRTWAIVSGIIGIIAGIIVLANPVISAVTLAWVLGLFLIVHGVIAIVSAFSDRRAATA